MFEMNNEESIYNKYKGYNRSTTPKKEIDKELSFNPFVEYERGKKFFDLSFKNIFKIFLLQIFNPEWFFFFILSQRKSKKSWKLSEHESVDDCLRKRMCILFLAEFFILSLIPLVFFFFYVNLGIVSFFVPSQQLFISFFVLVDGVIFPLLSSGWMVNYFSILPSNDVGFITNLSSNFLYCTNLLNLFNQFI